jgi:hypothetical protein
LRAEFIWSNVRPDGEHNSVRMSNVVYNVKCPKCSAKATARMHATGTAGTYREPMIKLGARLIVCDACGFFWKVPLDKSDSYELWYVTNFKGHRLWACNNRHLFFLISWISGDRSKIVQLGIANRARMESLPKWMLLAKNRVAILKRLRSMAGEGAKKPNRRTKEERFADRRR